LIAFSDCEGSIGPVVCAKLHADFVAWRARAEAYAANAEGFMENYGSFTEAFAMGAKNGAVCLV